MGDVLLVRVGAQAMELLIDLQASTEGRGIFSIHE